jgi:hypothetical protein
MLVLTFRTAAQADTSQASHASTTTTSALLFLSNINQDLSICFPQIEATLTHRQFGVVVAGRIPAGEALGSNHPAGSSEGVAAGNPLT